MCNCYNHECEACDTPVPMHIHDFEHPPSAFRVWCGSHLAAAPPDAVIFTITEVNKTDSEMSEWFSEEMQPVVGWSCAILGPGVAVGRNAPNWSSRMRVAKKGEAEEVEG